MQESAEMYLETIYILTNQLSEVKAIDIANKMNFSKPSVSKGLKNLIDKGLIYRDDKQLIYLTHEGNNQAKTLFEKHNVITRFLQLLGVDHSNAENDACKIEHILSTQSFDCIKLFVQQQDGLSKTISCIY
ncbi:MAG: metal-dependent transcriptional regulator [Clostridiales bacterium]|jgi:Mn-dependent DtxR family transcriptional regulator|nr:metal-dependent transcriptional regulator [Clostridiales bacterium]